MVIFVICTMGFELVQIAPSSEYINVCLHSLVFELPLHGLMVLLLCCTSKNVLKQQIKLQTGFTNPKLLTGLV